MKKRNAVILTGFMRNYEKTVGNFHKNLITSDDVDVFIATWNYRGVKKPIKTNVLLTDGETRKILIKDRADDSEVSFEDIDNKYSPKSLMVDDLDLFEEAIEQYAKIVETSNILNNQAKKKPKSYLTLMRRYTIFYLSYQGWKLMENYANENNIDYQKVVKVRADFERKGYYPKINWKEKIPKGKIKIGNWNLQNYPAMDSRIKFQFQDHFAIGNYEDMKVYFDMYNNLYKLSHEFKYEPKQWHAEYCLSLWLMMNNISCSVLKKKK
tara:strand:+ start:6453 stop:7253 length:801 start_codon:yes stop_codon:yes gene_type:complete